MDNTQVASRQVFAYRWISRSVLTMVALGVCYVLICQCSNRVTVVNCSSQSIDLRSMEKEVEGEGVIEPAVFHKLSSRSVISPGASQNVVLNHSWFRSRLVVLDLKSSGAMSIPSIILQLRPWGTRDFVERHDGLPGYAVRREMTKLREMYEIARQRLSPLLNLPE